MSIFRLLHLSDSHFCLEPNRHSVIRLFNDPPALSIRQWWKGRGWGLFPSSYDPDVAQGAARFIYQRKSNIDCVVYSGDIATTGQPDDLKVGLRFTTDPPANAYLSASKSPTISFVNDRILLFPGNHDRYMNDSCAPGCANFDFIFSKSWNVRRPDVKRKVFLKDGVHIVLIAADFTLETWSHASPPAPQNWMGQGKVYREVLRKLQDATEKAREDFVDCIIIWSVHFPPVANCDSKLRLIDFHLLTELADQKGISVILCGHLHENASYNMSNGTRILSAGSMSCCDEIENLWIHTIDIDVKSSQEINFSKIDYRWDDDAGDFTQAGSVLSFSFPRV